MVAHGPCPRLIPNLQWQQQEEWLPRPIMCATVPEDNYTVRFFLKNCLVFVGPVFILECLNLIDSLRRKLGHRGGIRDNRCADALYLCIYIGYTTLIHTYIFDISSRQPIVPYVRPSLVFIREVEAIWSIEWWTSRYPPSGHYTHCDMSTA